MRAILKLAGFVLSCGLLLTACTSQPTPIPPTRTPLPTTPAELTLEEVEQSFVPAIEIPDIEEGKFNVAFIYPNPIGDRGWSYAQNQGRLYVAENGENIHTAYMENVLETEVETVIRQLARNGFDLIFAPSFAYGEAAELVASEFPDTTFIHVSGVRKNNSNFGNLFGSMESMKYLAGLIAGARAKADNNFKIGYVAAFPIPEVIRQLNAFALGVRQSCAECEIELIWMQSWFDPELEQKSVQRLIDKGVGVIATYAYINETFEMIEAAGLYSMGHDSDTACNATPNSCLTASYWQWGPVYLEVVQEVQAGTFQPSDYYFDVDKNGVGLLGFMLGQTPSAAIPAEIMPVVQETLAKMQAGEYNRFDIFTGPINNNEGVEVIPAGVKITQSDLEGIDEASAGVLGRPVCTFCMDWLAEGIVGEVPRCVYCSTTDSDE